MSKSIPIPLPSIDIDPIEIIPKIDINPDTGATTEEIEVTIPFDTPKAK